MALDTALGARRDGRAGDRSARGLGDVSDDRGLLTGGRDVDVVAPRPLGQATNTLRATPRVAPAAPSSRSACGGLCLLVPRPVRQLSVGASRAVSSRPDQDPSALRALRCGSSLGPVVPRRRSRPLSRALRRTGRGNGWQDTCPAVPPVPVSAPVPGAVQMFSTNTRTTTGSRAGGTSSSRTGRAKRESTTAGGCPPTATPAAPAGQVQDAHDRKHRGSVRRPAG